MTEKQLEKYINGKYIGIIKGNYDGYCQLRAGEINNFVQNAGKYADLEIIKLKNNEVLFDTSGQLINKILPDLTETARTSAEGQKLINQIASKLNEMMENDKMGDEPIRKVKVFMTEMFGEDMTYKNENLAENDSETLMFHSHSM